MRALLAMFGSLGLLTLTACSLPFLAASTSNGTYTIRVVQVERDPATMRNQFRPKQPGDVLVMIRFQSTDPVFAPDAYSGETLRRCGPLKTPSESYAPLLGGLWGSSTFISGATPARQDGDEGRHCTYVVNGDVRSAEWQPEGYGPVNLRF